MVSGDRSRRCGFTEFVRAVGPRVGVRGRLALLGAACFAASTTTLAPAPTQAAVDPTIYRCTFTDGQLRTFSNGAFEITPAKDLTFRIGNIDLRAQTAQLITDKGADQLRIVRAINANHFLEVVTEGFLNMTTIYEPMAGASRLPAVHSRHFGLLGEPVVTQYSGFCVPESN